MIFWRLFFEKGNRRINRQISELDRDETPIGSACLTLRLAKTMDKGLIRNEYVEMFIGVGRGEVLPFASYYLTGFLNDKPLSNLRADMADIGIVRVKGVKEPEDHLASLFDIMSGLIRGLFGRIFRPLNNRFFQQTYRTLGRFIDAGH